MGFAMLETVVNTRYMQKVGTIMIGSGSTIVTFLLGINAVIEEVDYVANVTHGEIGAL